MTYAYFVTWQVFVIKLTSEATSGCAIPRPALWHHELQGQNFTSRILEVERAPGLYIQQRGPCLDVLTSFKVLLEKVRIL